uniref:Uncharacterized protein n=1 Tax=Romanomermis culicivorax TaxID=13658 RepID=A0A915JP76_ROMCU
MVVSTYSDSVENLSSLSRANSLTEFVGLDDTFFIEDFNESLIKTSSQGNYGSASLMAKLSVKVAFSYHQTKCPNIDDLILATFDYQKTIVRLKSIMKVGDHISEIDLINLCSNTLLKHGIKIKITNFRVNETTTNNKIELRVKTTYRLIITSYVTYCLAENRKNVKCGLSYAIRSCKSKNKRAKSESKKAAPRDDKAPRSTPRRRAAILSSNLENLEKPGIAEIVSTLIDHNKGKINIIFDALKLAADRSLGTNDDRPLHNF